MSSPRRLGLPDTLRLRHDAHYVDHLARPAGEPIGRLIPIEDIDPNPHQPRRQLGDLSELVASVREKGILEPILVRRNGRRFQILAGERRYRAAVEAEIDEVPCIVKDASDAEMMEIALIENLQRKDLSAFEEADGLKALIEEHGYTHQMMAERLGKGRTSITESLALTQMPEAVRELCRRADIQSKSLLLQVVRQSQPEKMRAFVEELQQAGPSREEARRLTRESKKRVGRGRPRHYVFRFEPREKTFSLALQFRKGQASREEVVAALRRILEEIESGTR